VRGFLKEFREMKTRGVKNADYTIPQLMLPLVREATEKSSKLMKHVNHQYLGGEGTQNILTTVPEAIWTETIGKLNEIDFGFDRIRTGGSKLGAYVAVPNPYLEDSDESLAAIVIDFLGQANGYGLDKAIIYGTGSNMPVGIMTRLAASAQPT
jgi:HK97 family phage major capsid protein